MGEVAIIFNNGSVNINIPKDNIRYMKKDINNPVFTLFVNSFLSVITLPMKKYKGKIIASFIISYNKFTHDNCPAIE